MNTLVIGGDGFIGSALVRALQAAGHAVTATSRRGNGLPFNLEAPAQLPAADVAYIAAGVIHGAQPAPAWRANVDGTILVSKRLLAAGSFVVFLSSIAIYTRDDLYARQKAHVEAFLHTTDAAIVRLDKVRAHQLPVVTALLIQVGEERRSGVTTWG